MNSPATANKESVEAQVGRMADEFLHSGSIAANTRPLRNTPNDFRRSLAC
jgi:hypothetical protein